MKSSILVPFAVSTIYCIVIMIICSNDRVPSSGGFVNLPGLPTFLATFPSSLLIEKVSRFDVKSNVCVAAAMLMNAALIFALLFGVLKLFRVK